MIFNLPNDIFKHELLQYLTLYDIAIFDTAIINHKYRVQLLNKISKITFKENINIYKFNIKLFYNWLKIRDIRNMFKTDKQIILMPIDKIENIFDLNICSFLNYNEQLNYFETINLNTKIHTRYELFNYICKNSNNIKLIDFIINKYSVWKFSSNWKIIHFICRYSSPTMIQYIIDNSIDLEPSTTYGWKPIHFICRYSTPEMIKYIIDKNVNLDVNTKSGLKPIHFICKYSTYDIIKYIKSKNIYFDCLSKKKLYKKLYKKIKNIYFEDNYNDYFFDYNDYYNYFDYDDDYIESI